MEIASAGHPPPLLLDASGAHLLPSTPRSMLGLGFGPTAGLPDETLRIPVPPDALLLLYSDGLVERRDASLEETTAVLTATAAEAVTRLLAQERSSSVAANEPGDGHGPGRAMADLAQQLLSAVHGEDGGNEDDTTLVLVRPRPRSSASPAGGDAQNAS